MTTLGPGDRAPDVAAVDLDSRERRLGLLLQRGAVVLAFGKSTCGTCDLAFPYLERLYQSYPPERWSLLALLQDSPGPARRFAERLGLTFPVVTEVAPYPISQAYDPEATPTIFLIGADGLIADALGGFAKAGLNRLAAEVAERIGVPPVEVAPAGDGKPAFRPG